MSERPTIDRLHAGYQTNRLPALEGTQPASNDFFIIWRENGLFQAIGNLVDVQRAMGDPRIPVGVRTFMTLAGSAVLATGVGQSQRSDDQSVEPNPQRARITKRLGKAAFTAASWALLTTWWEDPETTKIRLLQQAAADDEESIAELNRMSQRATGNPQSKGWYIESGRREGDPISYTKSGTFDKEGRPVPDPDSKKKG